MFRIKKPSVRGFGSISMRLSTMYTDVPRCDASTSSGKFGSTKLVTSAMSVMRPVLGQGRFSYRHHIQLLKKLDVNYLYLYCNIQSCNKCPSSNELAFFNLRIKLLINIISAESDQCEDESSESRNEDTHSNFKTTIGQRCTMKCIINVLAACTTVNNIC